jgi:serine/threonine protein phosphatase PrpC
MRIRAGAKTDIGRARKRNEDSFLVREPLFAVADGMGGHRGGNVASSLALEVLGQVGEEKSDRSDSLVEGIRQANDRVLERGEADRDLRGMGTTITAVRTSDRTAHLAHVGDSRAYLFRQGALQQLTEDHTWVRRMVREGKLTLEEAGQHPQRSILTRALGVEGAVEVDQFSLDLQPGDRLLLCTDGLTNMLDDEAIGHILAEEPDLQAAADRLIEEANRAGGDDNITVVILGFDDEEDDKRPEGEPAGSPAVIPSPHTLSPVVSDGEALAPRRDGGGASAKRGLPWRRIAVWLALVVSIGVVALVATRIYVDRQWYVGVSNGQVAVYRGIPTRILGFHLSHVQEVGADVPAAQAEQLQPWSSLSQGITANSLEAARQIVNQIRQDLGLPVVGGSG